MSTTTQHGEVATTAAGTTGTTIGQLAGRGAVAGLFGGLFFILANMWFSTAHGKPAVAPFLSISTIFYGSDKPMMTPEAVVAGLTMHLFLSMLYGMVFAVVVLPFLRNRIALVIGALVYGLLLYIVNFQILARIFFPFFVNPMGPNQGFELWIHPVAFGLFLIPFFLAMPAPGHGSRAEHAE